MLWITRDMFEKKENTEKEVKTLIISEVIKE